MCRWAFSLYSIEYFCFTLLELHLLSCFPLVFKYMSCKTLSIQYKWNYVNSKSICVISLFISPILDLNWWSDLIVKDCQQGYRVPLELPIDLNEAHRSDRVFMVDKPLPA